MTLDIWNQIEKKQIAPIYLVYGTEAFLISETKQRLIKHVLAEGEAEFNLSTYDLEETPVEVAIEDAETFPFMGEKRLVILDNPVFLTAEKTKEKVDHNIARLEAYIKEPSPFSVLVVAAPYEKLDERKKITKELKKNAVIVEANKLGEKELKNWVRTRAKANNKEIDDSALELMLALVGTNLFMLTSEIDKLCLFAGSETTINSEIVDKLVARSLEQNIFTLVDKVVHRKIDEALRIYYDLLKQNEEPIKILSVIASQFRLIYQVKELSRRGYGQQQIAGYIKTHPFRVKLAAGQAQYFKDEELARIIGKIAEADHLMKTGGMQKELLIELILFKLHEDSIAK